MSTELDAFRTAMQKDAAQRRELNNKKICVHQTTTVYRFCNLCWHCTSSKVCERCNSPLSVYWTKAPAKYENPSERLLNLVSGRFSRECFKMLLDAKADIKYYKLETGEGLLHLARRNMDWVTYLLEKIGDTKCDYKGNYVKDMPDNIPDIQDRVHAWHEWQAAEKRRANFDSVKQSEPFAKLSGAITNHIRTFV